MIEIIGGYEAKRKCSSSDGMANIYTIYDGTESDYYLIDYTAEPYIKKLNSNIDSKLINPVDYVEEESVDDAGVAWANVGYVIAILNCMFSDK